MRTARHSRSDLPDRINKARRGLQSEFGEGRIRVNELLAPYCNWKVGGPADLFLRVQTTDELKSAVTIARSAACPMTILGFGANVLVSDAGIRGLVILNRAERLVFHSNSVVEADSGTSLAVLAKRTAKHGVGGMEFLIGIPGTVGAAVFGNAGTGEKWISHILQRVRLLDEAGAEHVKSHPELKFGYRSSVLQTTRDVVLTAWLQGRPETPGNSERELQRQLDLRKNQPGGPSTGSVFKNPDNDFAGRLIEACGLKGHRIGGAQVSQMHANFILNTGSATAEQIRELIVVIKAKVETQAGVKLREEIRYLGEFS